MGKAAKLFEIIYLDTQEAVPVLVGIGAAIQATDWAEKQHPYPPKPDLTEGLSAAQVEFNLEEYRAVKRAVDETREARAGLYAVFLGAEQGKLRGTEAGWLEWLSMVTAPDEDEDDVETPTVGEAARPPSEV